MAIVVHGRWDAFDLARELDERGHEIRLLTNYPVWAIERFGVPTACIRAFPLHGALMRAFARIGLEVRMEPSLHKVFGRWAAARVVAERWDVVYAFSGIAEEAFHALESSSSQTLRILVRESAHVRAQDHLLREEEQRTGVPQARPSAWRIAREEREYALADLIRVLSSFTYQTFVEHGTEADRLALVVSGARVERFRPPLSTISDRIARIQSGAPLHILNVGTFALRKGMWDMAALVRQLGTQRFQFRFVGPVLGEAASLADELRRAGVEFIPKQPESELPDAYAWGDLFVLPSIEDGFPAVLAHASAAGLPILTTPNGAGHDLVRHGSNGWVLPIRQPRAFAEQLEWADTHRTEVAIMARETYDHFQPRDFSQVAAELETVCRAHLPNQPVGVGL